MSCPFASMFGSNKDTASCPFLKSFQTGFSTADQVPEQASQAPSPVTNILPGAAEPHFTQDETSAASLCSNDCNAASSHLELPASPTSSTSTRGVCPLGFGSSSGPKLSALHCMLCKSFFHECTQIKACGHKFCRFCIQRFADCPACGVDMDELVADEHTQGLVAQLIAAADSHQSLLPSQAQGSNSSPQRATATFLMELGLQSFAGGNYQAAFERLEACKQLIQPSLGANSRFAQVVEEHPQSPNSATSDRTAKSHTDNISNTIQHSISSSKPRTAATSADTQTLCQLATILGCQGDCCRRVGDDMRAAALYKASLDNLQGCDEADPEVLQLRAVTTNKLGDLQYCNSNFVEARRLYSQVLQQRRAQAAAGNTGIQLDLLSSLVKVADACQASGADEASQQAIAEASQMVQQLEGNVADTLSPPEAMKLLRIQAAIEQLKQKS